MNNINQASMQVLDIYLDTENPRHDPIKDQDKIIEYLVSNEKIKPLAKDIVNNGISPIDLFAVLEDDSGRYIVLEGNRRLCALILLNDPEKSPSSARSYFQKLSKKVKSPINEIRSVVFKSREEADIWIDRRHEGEQDGIGIIKWDAIQKTRRNRNKQKRDPNALAQELLEYAVGRGYLTQDQTKKILTTATRYLGNPRLRKTMGIVSSRTADVEINVSYQDFDKVVERFCNDLANEGSGVSSRSKKADWEKYADQLIRENVAPSNFCSEHKLSDTDVFLDDDEDKPDPPKPKPQISPDKRKYIIPNGFNPPIRDKKLRRAFEELRKISVQEFPLAVALVCRAFLESLYVLLYEKKIGDSIDSKTRTHIVLKNVIELIEKDKATFSSSEKEALGALKRVQSNENNVLSAKTLGANAHLSHYPNATELNREWDNIEAILLYMLEKI